MLSRISKIRGEEEKIAESTEDLSAEKVIKTKKRRSKNERVKYELNREQSKFMVDLSSDKIALELVFKLLLESNQKDYGHEITFKELAIFALERLSSKDVEKIQEGSLSEMEKVERALKEFNSKNGTHLSLGEFLVKKLNIN
ncbi:MAG: hypothetical protein A2451_12440 [Bdellovibrionales bacterium RIFOXYC2_FULL_39_8]|nr:MAG: hypothetical protein A2485_04770 [Bdellovibrionales bacterium RIFOXYC12_FULL_39_17]OFZ69480.1 MAG: hypothetical protein A2451_12440 [Bdellovibrionales bacterium RIFOXYC2_FULL_39_8]HLE12975.1 hypothetical protein [Bacteriovoracaceae bacterium]